MKKSIFCFLLVLLLMVNSGCSYVAYKEYYTDTCTYTDIWNLAGIRRGIGSGNSIFPNNIADLNVEGYFCRYDEQLPLGEGIQIFLRIRYDEDTSFPAEKERIQSMSHNCDEYFSADEYDFFATHFSETGIFEYAAISHNEQVIYYFYLQDLPYEEIEIDGKFIPNGYMGYGEFVETIEFP